MGLDTDGTARAVLGGLPSIPESKEKVTAEF